VDAVGEDVVCRAGSCGDGDEQRGRDPAGQLERRPWGGVARTGSVPPDDRAPRLGAGQADPNHASAFQRRSAFSPSREPSRYEAGCWFLDVFLPATATSIQALGLREERGCTGVALSAVSGGASSAPTGRADRDLIIPTHPGGTSLDPPLSLRG
jgi:hypothetical protein